tara:strand:- start:6902 stop:8275 length:1374 start_codon:yes stop_codon:yes gene_type:complete
MKWRKNNSIFTIGRIIQLYFTFICFMYYFQVTLSRKDFVPLIFLFLFVYTIFTIYSLPKSKLASPALNTFFEFFYYYIIYMALWVGYEILVNPTGIHWLRMFIYFVCPICLFFLITKCEENFQINDIWSLQTLIVLLAMITGIEAAYEWLHVNYFRLGTTDFMEKSYQYVQTLGHGTIAGQIAKKEGVILRPPGILGHIHITGTFLGIGILTAIHLFYSKKSTAFLIIGYLLLTMLVIIGARTALVAAIFSTGLYIFHNNRIIKSSFSFNRKKFNYFIRIFSISIFASILVLWYARETFYLMYSQYFKNSLFKLQFADDHSFFDMFFQNLQGVFSQIFENPVLIPLGNGYSSFKGRVGASGDLLLGTLFAKYGIVGMFIIFSILLLFIISMRKTIGFVLLPPEVKEIANYSLALVVLLIITALHSPVLMRKEIYSYLFLGYGLGWWAYVQGLKKVVT